jgi:uncharacterized membrane protein
MTRTAWLICLGLTAAAFAASGIVYANRQFWLPETVPVHWNIRFEPDAWTTREGLFWYLMGPPLGMLAVTVLLPLLIYWLSPRGFEPSKGNPQVANTVVVLVVALMGALHTVILLQYLGNEVSIPIAMMGVLYTFFLLLGNMLGKVQRNFWIGIRTPWTLANHVVWEKTHRLGAWCFAGAGFLGLVSLFFSGVLPMPVLVALWIGLIAVASLVPATYSLVLYKRMERAVAFDGPALVSSLAEQEVHHV